MSRPTLPRSGVRRSYRSASSAMRSISDLRSSTPSEFEYAKLIILVESDTPQEIIEKYPTVVSRVTSSEGDYLEIRRQLSSQVSVKLDTLITTHELVGESFNRDQRFILYLKSTTITGLESHQLVDVKHASFLEISQYIREVMEK